ncbi:MAG: hypothetical protein KIT83_04900 [Bryobacterales bacterium]|nr:hypothetical protein [Bryobacterales bacterium]
MAAGGDHCWALATHTLSRGDDFTLTLTPPRPFGKGTALGVEVQDLRLRLLDRQTTP